MISEEEAAEIHRKEWAEYKETIQKMVKFVSGTRFQIYKHLRASFEEVEKTIIKSNFFHSEEISKQYAVHIWNKEVDLFATTGGVTRGVFETLNQTLETPASKAADEGMHAIAHRYVKHKELRELQELASDKCIQQKLAGWYEAMVSMGKTPTEKEIDAKHADFIGDAQAKMLVLDFHVSMEDFCMEAEQLFVEKYCSSLKKKEPEPDWGDLDDDDAVAALNAYESSKKK